MEQEPAVTAAAAVENGTHGLEPAAAVAIPVVAEDRITVSAVAEDRIMAVQTRAIQAVFVVGMDMQ